MLTLSLIHIFYAELALEIETFARQMHYNVMLCNSIHYENNIGELMDFLISHQVDGIILGSSRNEARACLHEYHKTIPSVLLGASISDEDEYCVNAVSVDNRAGGRMAAEYLLGLGHRDITYLGFRPSSITHQLRYHGFLCAMEPVSYTHLDVYKRQVWHDALVPEEKQQAAAQGPYKGNQLSLIHI